jgi:CRISPR-associated protein Cas1
MVTLYVSREDGMLGKRDKALCYKKERTGSGETFPTRLIDDVVILGNASISTPAIHLMLDNNIPLHFIDGKGQYKGSLTSGRGRGYVLRHLQMDAALDKDASLEIARSFVWGKLKNQLTTLRRALNRNHAGDAVLRVCEDIKTMSKHLPYCKDIDAVRGIEGYAAAAYFSVFGHLLRDPWIFQGRNRRPPRDPINAMLSFGYTLLLSHVTSAVTIAGLDPCIGFLHPEYRGRPSMALDLMEEYRSQIVDRLVLSIANQMILKKDNFLPIEDGGVYMDSETRKIFLRCYLNRVNESTKNKITGQVLTYRNHIFASACYFVSSLRHREKYLPFEASDHG